MNFNKNLLISLITSLFVAIIIVGVTGFFVWQNKNTVFNFFASEYIEQEQAKLLANNVNNQSLNEETKNSSSQINNIFNKENSITNVVEKTNQAVVAIVITKEVPLFETYLE